MKDKHGFIHQDKHQSFLHADSIVFTGHSQTCRKYQKLQVCNIFAIYQIKKEEIKLIFLLADKHHIFLQVDNILEDMTRHDHGPKLHKIASL